MRILFGRSLFLVVDIAYLVSKAEPRFEWHVSYRLGLYSSVGVGFTVFGRRFDITHFVPYSTYLKANAARNAWLAEEKKQESK